MKISVSNHAIRRYRERVEDEGRKERGRAEISNIIRKAVSKHPKSEDLRECSQLPWIFAPKLEVSLEWEGEYFGEYRLELIRGGRNANGYVVKTIC
jgi:hypothetical protein